MSDVKSPPEDRHNFIAATILVALIVSSLAFFKFQEEREARQYCETRLAEMPSTWDVVDTDAMLTAFWYTQHPCGLQMQEYPLRAIDGPPTPEMCDQARQIVAERETARLTPQDRYADGIDFYELISCASSGAYEGNPDDKKRLMVDTVDAPWRTSSWVLGGECEKLALALQKRGQAPMCREFVKNDPVTASKCREELGDHLDLLCERDDLDDSQLRECLTMWGRKKKVKR